VYSCSAGACKPELAIYCRAIREAGVPAEQILYIDDEPKYVEAGRRAGMQAIVFTGAEPLLAELHHRGILRA
jgi:HAD superfamily hydrolase (TIGR01509 family)